MGISDNFNIGGLDVERIIRNKHILFVERKKQAPKLTHSKFHCSVIYHHVKKIYWAKIDSQNCEISSYFGKIDHHLSMGYSYFSN